MLDKKHLNIKKMFLPLLKDAKDIIKKNGDFEPIAIPLIIDPKDNIGSMEPITFMCKEFENFLIEVEDSNGNLLNIGAVCRDQWAFGVIIRMDMCAREISNEEYFWDNLETELPSLYPKSLREISRWGC